MKNTIIIFTLSCILLTIFGVTWGSLDMYDTPEANIWIAPFWGLYIGLEILLIWILKKYL